MSTSQLRVLLIAITTVVATLCSPPAVASPQGPTCGSSSLDGDLGALLARGDIVALLAATRRATPGSTEADLLHGIAASYVMNDDEAARLLNRYIAGPSRRFSYYAHSALGNIAMRDGRYAQAAKSLKSALTSRASALVSPDELRAAKQAAVVAAALREISPQTISGTLRGAVAIKRDAAQLPTGSLTINNKEQRAVFDTGANLSVTIRSRADALGLRILPDTVTIASPVSAVTKAQLGVADAVEVGGAVFNNVVFIVFPDEAMTFAGGAYQIEAILGFPVLSQLGRLQFAADPGGERLTFERSALRPKVDTAKANLFVEGLTPKVVACSVPDHVPVQFALDSGAEQTSLRPRFSATFPALVKNAVPTKSVQGGAGGTVERETRVVPSVTLDFGGTVLTLRNLEMSEESLVQGGDHGRIGQDVLRARGGYTLDFDLMRFALETKHN
jgi:predicted aspartyl protease